MSAVRDNSQHNRFEMDTPGGLAFASYRRDGSTLTVFHTEVPRVVGTRGLGTRLVTQMLDQIRARGEMIVPRCPFVRHVIEQHPDYAGLVKRT
jgi:predicted GNAT family acetyltransferase